MQASLDAGHAVYMLASLCWPCCLHVGFSRCWPSGHVSTCWHHYMLAMLPTCWHHYMLSMLASLCWPCSLHAGISICCLHAGITMLAMLASLCWHHYADHAGITMLAMLSTCWACYYIYIHWTWCLHAGVIVHMQTALHDMLSACWHSSSCTSHAYHLPINNLTSWPLPASSFLTFNTDFRYSDNKGFDLASSRIIFDEILILCMSAMSKAEFLNVVWVSFWPLRWYYKHLYPADIRIVGGC